MQVRGRSEEIQKGVRWREMFGATEDHTEVFRLKKGKRIPKEKQRQTATSGPPRKEGPCARKKQVSRKSGQRAKQVPRTNESAQPLEAPKGVEKNRKGLRKS